MAVGQLQIFWRTLRYTLMAPSRAAKSSRELTRGWIRGGRGALWFPRYDRSALGGQICAIVYDHSFLRPARHQCTPSPSSALPSPEHLAYRGATMLDSQVMICPAPASPSPGSHRP